MSLFLWLVAGGNVLLSETSISITFSAAGGSRIDATALKRLTATCKPKHTYKKVYVSLGPCFCVLLNKRICYCQIHKVQSCSGGPLLVLVPILHKYIKI